MSDDLTKYTHTGSVAFRRELRQAAEDVFRRVGRTVSQKEFVQLVKKQAGKGSQCTIEGIYRKLLREQARGEIGGQKINSVQPVRAAGPSGTDGKEDPDWMYKPLLKGAFILRPSAFDGGNGQDEEAVI